jgi:DNA invertase Pin-like site-specific DNA recombinase
VSTRTPETGARCVIYDRVSESDPESQAEHVRRCQDAASAKGWEVVAVETDTASGFSRTAKRPGWDKVVAMVERDEVDAVLVFATSRAGRNLASFAAFVEKCRDHGVTFASATEPIDSAGPWGGVFSAILGALAEMESLYKRERALVGEARHKRDRTFRGGNLPFGFRVGDGGRVLVDEAEAVMIRDAVRDVANGTSLEAIARRWNEAGIFTHPGNGRTVGSRWTGSHVRAVIGAERNVEWGVVTATDRRRVVDVFDARRTGRVPDRYLLAGLVRCAIHDRPLRGRQGRYTCGHEPGVKVHLSVRRGPLNALVSRVAECRHNRKPFKPQDLQDPTDDLVRDRERLVAELEALGDSDLSEHVIRGRERKLVRDLQAVEERLERTTPRPRDFKQQWEAKMGAKSAEFVRRYVRRVEVAPATRPGARFDPRRVTVTYADGKTASEAEVVAAWGEAQKLARADTEDAEWVAAERGKRN